MEVNKPRKIDAIVIRMNKIWEMKKRASVNTKADNNEKLTNELDYCIWKIGSCLSIAHYNIIIKLIADVSFGIWSADESLPA